MEVKTCCNCRYYEPNSPEPIDGGECRRHAPTPSLGHGEPAYWAAVLYGDWCGDHELKFNYKNQEAA